MKIKYALLAGCVGCLSLPGISGNAANPNAVELMPIPVPISFSADMDAPVSFDAATTVCVECPDKTAVAWLRTHFVQWFGEKNAPKVVAGPSALTLKPGAEAYAVSARADGVKIAARSLAGVRWAAYTLRQMLIAKRGTLKTAGRLLPSLTFSDAPHLAFRGLHLCWFPETRPQQIERAIRLAALLKFNYAIIETWGMYQSEKHPWWRWPNSTMTKAEVRRLAAIGKDLGITLIPQINLFGHATSSRGCTLKHVVLDLHPEYEPLFEPGGWNWCLTNPETQRVQRDLIAELHDDFGRPPYFHLGCDEAQPPTCPDCRKAPYGELVCKHITGLAEFVKSRGARPMMWHDMLLERGDKRWRGFVHFGSKTTATLADTLPRDVVICDWQYSYGNMRESRQNWPTLKYFKDKGFDVAGCPWMNYNAMKPMANYISKIGGFGIIETTWHHLRGNDWCQMFKHASAAAWGTRVPPTAPMYDTHFATALRLVGHDMKVTDYEDTGHLNHQVPPKWWAH
jgi:hypothetical protein